MYKGLVSILIPTYNREKIILETLNSAVSQTYKNTGGSTGQAYQARHDGNPESRGHRRSELAREPFNSTFKTKHSALPLTHVHSNKN